MAHGPLAYSPGKWRQYAAFAGLSLAVVAACIWFYPQARSGQLLVVYARDLLDLGQTEQAMARLREAVRQGSIPIGGLDDVIETALAAEDSDSSRELIQRLMDKGRPVASGLVGRAAGLLDARGDAADALALLETRRALGPLARAETLHLGDLLRRTGRFADALALYDGMLARDPNDTAAAADRAETFLWMGRPAEAEAAARDLLSRVPGSRAAQVVLARARAASGDAAGAMDQYRNLLGDTP
ncbi:MAG: tetratricopeptide repeat protein [Desulfovibrionaceae bacterium]